MANNLFAFQGQIEITDSNKYFEYGIFPLYTKVSVSITTGYYADMKAVCTALDAVTTGFTFSIGSTGLVTISSGISVRKLFWKTGTHGSNNADDHIFTILGFNDTDSETGAVSHTSDYQHQFGWYPNQVPALESGNRIELFGGPKIRTDAGYYNRQTKTNAHYLRNFEFRDLPKERILTKYATGSYTNQDFETFYSYAERGNPFSVYQHTDVIDSSSALGTYGVCDGGYSTDKDAVPRKSVEVEYYNVTLKTMKEV